MNIKNKLIHLIGSIIPNEPQCILNINTNLLDNRQKKILLCYIVSSLKKDLKGTIFHPNISRCNQMITSLINLGYAVDVCDANDISCFPYIQKQDYVAVIGFGALYSMVCRMLDIKYKIIYMTENDPECISEKYAERLEYFHKRHPQILLKPKSKRVQFYTSEQFLLSNKAIIMTNDFNSARIKKIIPDNYVIKCNGLLNSLYKFNVSNIAERRSHFLWFGSTGLIQKGLDILFDVFREMPELTLDVYGANKRELKSVKSIIPPNVNIYDRIDVQTTDFLEIVYRHLFIISTSCLEGMQSGVSTCMRHGLIPLLTHECGYDEHNFIFHFNDFRIETVKNRIQEVLSMSDSDLALLSQEAYRYANKEHTLESFTFSFQNIVKSILRF